ncbi:hypothetical protein [Nocardia sp. NBC_00403]|uniref:hypothetical protein n=1 Tax=Nocardia sp. NBC_00403 TaxID=2975990 RepID=UPI002E1C0C5A
MHQQQASVTCEVIEPPTDRTDKWAVRTRERYNAVHALLGGGVSIRAIGAQLDLARGTVRRFARAASADELLVNNGTGRRASLLDEFKPYLHQRWNEGCANATQLFGEIQELGYRGGRKILLNYLHQSARCDPREGRTAGGAPGPAEVVRIAHRADP